MQRVLEEKETDVQSSFMASVSDLNGEERNRILFLPVYLLPLILAKLS